MRLFFLILIFISSFSAHPQSYSRYSFGASLGGTYTGSFNSGTTSSLVRGNQTYKAYADSAAKLESAHLTPALGIWIHLFISRRWSFQTGLTFMNVGFSRVHDNIQYLDSTYPGMGQGRILEKSGVEKRITYNYRFQYLQLPVLVNYEFYNSRNFYTRVSFTGGLGLNYLINHSIRAKLDQFVVEGENKYVFDSTGYTPRKLTFHLVLGAKGEYRLDKKAILYVMPVFGYYPVSVTSGPFSTHPYYFQLNVGLQYVLNLKEDDK